MDKVIVSCRRETISPQWMPVSLSGAAGSGMRDRRTVRRPLAAMVAGLLCGIVLVGVAYAQASAPAAMNAAGRAHVLLLVAEVSCMGQYATLRSTHGNACFTVQPAKVTAEGGSRHGREGCR